MRDHWNNCIMHDDEEVSRFILGYFGREDRRCFLVAGAGFDPRAQQVATKLSETMGGRLRALLIREERLDAAEALRVQADDNEVAIRKLIHEPIVEAVRVFDSTDNAPVGGQRTIELLRQLEWPEGITDVVLDMSALSTGVAFPAASYLLQYCEAHEGLSFHIMISSNPELDSQIIGEPYATPSMVRGFAGEGPAGLLPVARIWLPQLAAGRRGTLEKILAAQESPYKICPILPFPARNPRRADDLLAEFRPLLDERAVDARDFIYVSERNPLDSFRKLSMLKERYDRTMKDVYQPELLLSPVGSKVMAVGAMMAALKHNLPIQHVENVRYEYAPRRTSGVGEPRNRSVHIWLHGPVYAGYNPPAAG
jgi:hypothetical protein